MSSIRRVAVLVILAVIVTGISMANRPNEGDGINITASPSTLVLSRDSVCVTIHTNIPIGLVDRSSLLLSGIEDYSIAPYRTKSDSLGHLVAKFNDLDEENDIRAIVAPGQVTLELTVDIFDGEEYKEFSASDKIRVK